MNYVVKTRAKLLFSSFDFNRATVLVLIIESRWTEFPKQKQFIIEKNSTCYLREDYEVIQDCHPCTGIFDFLFLHFYSSFKVYNDTIQYCSF